MYNYGEAFQIDLTKLRSKNEAMFTGQKYRITILTERLVRFEYSENGVYNDFATQLVTFRNFDVPKFEVREDKNYIEIDTSYMKISYTKEEPFKGTSISPTKNLKVEAKNTNFVWYFGHVEAKNYYGSNISAEEKETLFNASKK